MSIFKVKEWWSNEKLQNNEPVVGIQNRDCLAVDKFIGHSESDCVLVGEGSLIKIYKPNLDENISHILLETELNDSVLQISSGKFISGVEDRQIIVLHPRSYAIYRLKQKEGHTDAGDQNLLEPLIKHSFSRKAYSFTCGSFGNIRTRDFICIQGLDGSLSFFDQDTFLFMCIFNDIIIPKPVAYIGNCDSFIICKSTWVLEIYSYQQLREFSELNPKHNKKHIPQWIYNAGEEISHIQVIQSSSNFSSIVALGERYLYCFQDNGLMKYMIKFDFVPICFLAYLIGWYYEPTARLLVMVASEDSKLFIYESTTLLWSCDLLYSPVSIMRCYLKGLSGGLVTLSRNNIVTVCYLGTEPDLNSNAPPMINESIDPQQVQEELEAVEDDLQKILESKDPDDRFAVVDHIIKIKADVGKPVQNLFEEFPKGEEALHLLMCPIIVMLTCEDPKQVQSVQITYDCCFPFACSECTISLDGINGTEIIESQIFLSSNTDISETRVKVLFTIVDATGKIAVLTRQVLLPLSLYCKPVQEVTSTKMKLSVKCSHPCVEFPKIFTDFTEEELTKYGTSETVTFEYRSTKKTVTLRLAGQYYFVEADSSAEMTTILDHFLIRLTDHYNRMGVKDFGFELMYDQEFIKSLLHKFLKSIEVHAKERVKLNSLEGELEILHRQFTLVQKKLLVQYGSLPPGNCDALEFLMRDTHKRLKNTVYEIIQCKETVCRAGSTLSTVGQLVMYLLKQATRDNFKIKLIEEMMSLNALYEDHQEWEEAVTQAMSFILKNIFQKSEKDKEKLAPVTEQGVLSQINLKRCLKQIRMILEKMFFETREQSAQEHVKRVEEFVEVL